MIVFDLKCSAGHVFEGWFGSSADYAEQQDRGLLRCPVCDDRAVSKSVMAPNIAAKSSQRAEPAPHRPATAAPFAAGGSALPPQAVALLRKIAEVQAEALKQSDYVGPRFADEVRAMHYGETDKRLVHGEAAPDEAKALAEEGISIMPILFPLVPPEQQN